jgi:hypothetical protein
MKSMSRFQVFVLCSFLVTPAFAEDPETPAPVEKVAESESVDTVRDTSPMIEAVDIPTADILDPKTFSTSFRFYSEGGITSRLLLGPFKRLNLGFYLDAQRLIGGPDPHLIAPAVFIKLRVFDGTDYLPALAFGYDNQGYLYRESIGDFTQPEKGLYLVGSHEIFIPDFELHAGINFPRIDESGTPFGFFGATWKIVPAFALMTEYDNIQDGPENRFNAGGRFWVTPFFNVDVAARNIGRGTSRGAERIVRINYVANFPF